RAQAILHASLHHLKDVQKAVVPRLNDKDAFVRRRACEALIRAGIEPPVASLWPLLGDSDRFVRHAARLVLERIEPKQWADKVWKEPNDLIAWNGIIALCHMDKATPYAEQIFGRLRGALDPKAKDVQPLLDYLRTVQMAMIHVQARPAWVQAIATQCE